MSTILTDDELNRIIDSMGWSLDAQERGDMHRLIQAVLAKLAKQADRQRVPDGWREALQTARDAMAKENRIIPSAKFTAAISRIDAMLAAAPEAPAQAEPLCPNCGGSGEQAYLVGRGPDAHDEFGPCSVCDGVGIQPQASAVDERAIDAAARKIAECMDYPWEHMPEKGRSNMREHAKAVLDAARNALAQKGGAA